MIKLMLLLQLTAVANTTVIDGTHAPRPNATVLIRGRVIADVFPSGSKQLPPNTRIIDGAGKFLIPGLIDSHVHNATIEERPQNMTETILNRALLGGITTVRDMGGRSSNLRALAARAALDATPWPRIYYSAIIAGPGGWFEGARGTYMAEGGEPGRAPLVRLVANAEDIAAAITSARTAGATGIKIYNNIDPKLLPALVAEAKRHHLRVWSHLAVDPGKPSDLAKAGVEAMSHADQFIYEVFPWGTREARRQAFLSTPLNAPPLREMLSIMKQKQIALDATLFIMRPAPGADSVLFTFASGMVREANRMDVPIIAGTDALGRPNPNLSEELKLLVERAGLTPVQALQAATINAARVLGLERQIGSVDVAKIADLVLLDGNPLENIGNTSRVKLVIKGGVVVNMEEGRPNQKP